MTNTEAKGGEPLGFKGHNGTDCEFPLHIGNEIGRSGTPIYDKKGVGVGQFYDRATASTVVNILNDYNSGHDPSDSVVLSRERLEKIEALLEKARQVCVQTYTSGDTGGLCLTGQGMVLMQELTDGIAEYDYARSALAAAERGRG